MFSLIEEYYKKANIMPLLLNKKMAKFNAHPDIAKEFEYWLSNDCYKQEDVVEVEGRSAEDIAGLSPYMNGEGSFMLLIELRENPEKAKKRISDGFFKI